MSERVTFKVIVPHADDCQRYGWFFPNGWRGIGPIEKRDRAGRAAGKRRGYFADWFVLACNSPGCPGRATIPVSFITNHADDSDPSVDPSRWRDESGAATYSGALWVACLVGLVLVLGWGWVW